MLWMRDVQRVRDLSDSLVLEALQYQNGIQIP